MKKPIIVVALTVGTPVAILLGCVQRQDTPVSDSAPNPAVADGNGPKQDVHAIGYIEPASEVRRLSFKTGGVVAECRVTVGESVKKGSTLLILDDTDAQHAVAVAEAELAVAKAQRVSLLSGTNPFQIQAAEHTVTMWKERVDHAADEAARCRKLAQKRALSQAACDESETALQQATAQLRSAQAELDYLRGSVTPEDKEVAQTKVTLAQRRLEQARHKLTNTRLVAPFDGTVFEILRREGETISSLSPEPAVLFGDATRLRVRAEVDERYVHQIQEGQPAIVSGRGLGDECWSGRISLVKQMMGDKTVFSESASERRDLNVVQVLIDMDDNLSAPVGLRVDVTVDVDAHGNSSNGSATEMGAQRPTSE